MGPEAIGQIDQMTRSNLVVQSLGLSGITLMVLAIFAFLIFMELCCVNWRLNKIVRALKDRGSNEK